MADVAIGFEHEFFGSAKSVALMRRAANLHKLLRDDPRFSYAGRLVGLSSPQGDPLEMLGALASMQGATVAYFVPKEDLPGLFRRAEAIGFVTDRHEHFLGGEEAYAASRLALQRMSLPRDLTVRRLDAATPAGLVRETADLWESCEVMPVPGAIMRGLARPAICLAATDSAGAVVAVAASIGLHHRESTRATDVFWGMLATRPDRRGEKISLLLGAQAIVHMWETHGARGFMTGVRADNASSQALCNKLGVRDSRWAYATIIDPGIMPGGKVTK
jgi:hypothetical protein